MANDHLLCGPARPWGSRDKVVVVMVDNMNQAVIDQVLQAEAARLSAIDARDFDALDQLIGEDLSYVHSDTGQYEDKAANRHTLRTSPRSYKRRDLKVRLYGEVAVMTGEIDITIDAIPDESPERHVFSFATQVWVLRDGRWQMVVFQATMIQAKN